MDAVDHDMGADDHPRGAEDLWSRGYHPLDDGLPARFDL